MKLHAGHWLSALALVIGLEISAVWVISQVFEKPPPAAAASVRQVSLRLTPIAAATPSPSAPIVKPSKVTRVSAEPAPAPASKPAQVKSNKPKKSRTTKARPTRAKPVRRQQANVAPAQVSPASAKPAKAGVAADNPRRSSPKPPKPEAVSLETDVLQTPSPSAVASTSVVALRDAKPGEAAASQPGPRDNADVQMAALSDPGLRSSYQALIVARLLKYRQYPDKARQRGMSGTVTVQFELTASGQMVSRRIAASSGYPVLDQAAMTMLERASPMPPVPDGYGPAPYRFTIPLEYELQ
ncbi:MAG: energy transducer TonB [Burkholderiaceae bacterium]